MRGKYYTIQYSTLYYQTLHNIKILIGCISLGLILSNIILILFLLNREYYIFTNFLYFIQIKKYQII